MDAKIAVKKPTAKIKLQESIITVWYHEIDYDYIQKLIFPCRTAKRQLYHLMEDLQSAKVIFLLVRINEHRNISYLITS